MNIYKCYPEGKFKALTMSYDDGKEEDRRLVSIFNQYGIKGTFNLNSGCMDQPDKIQKEEIKELYQGHEVACHTYSHPTLERCPMPLITEEIMSDRKELENILGYPVRGMAYPNGSYNEDIVKVLPFLGIEYSRIVGDTDGFGMPDDFLAWKATCHHDHNLMENAKRFAEAVKSQYLYLMYVWGHSYEFSMHNNWELMEGFCSYIGNRQDVWYTTNIEFVDYMNVLKSLKFSAACNMVYNPCAKSAWISVNGQIVEIKGGMLINL
jgi:peptidoglycan/xylan/chitin deacetylase (PgdA/CDA1 family)